MKEWKVELKCQNEQEALKLLSWLTDAFQIAAATKLPMEFLSAEVNESYVKCTKIK